MSYNKNIHNKQNMNPTSFDVLSNEMDRIMDNCDDPYANWAFWYNEMELLTKQFYGDEF